MVKKVSELLLVEDDPTMALLCREYLHDQPCHLTHAETGEDALSHLQQEIYDAVLLDLTLPDMHGLEILRYISEQQLPSEVIVVTSDCSMNTVIEVMQAGARDFLAKPFSKSRLVTTLSNCFESKRLKEVVNTYREELDRHQFGGFIGSSLAMQRVYRVIESAAHSKATVFITGESGTGKEVCAEAIHNQSERSDKPFIAINCGAIPKDLIESEIFGHVKGAFTGALKDRDGAALAADGGTLFLDEICEMELALQSKLLRFLQTGTVQKVGSDRLEAVDVRIICATNKDPLKQVEDGAFREDLFYRLHVLPVLLPPLRERDNDVIEIAQQLLTQYAAEEEKAFNRFSEDVELALAAYPWPGNVRQLQNVIRNIVVLNEGAEVTVSMLPAPLDSDMNSTSATNQVGQLNRPSTTSGQSLPFPRVMGQGDSLSTQIRPLAELEREAIEHAITLCDGSIPTAAHYLGISAATIYRKRNSWKNQ